MKKMYNGSMNLNKAKASALRRWLVTRASGPSRTTRWTIKREKDGGPI